MANKKIRMAIDLKDLIKTLIEIIYLIIIIYVAYQVLKTIFGGTWASENIIIAGMGIILAGLFVVVTLLVGQAKSLGKLEERTQGFEKRIEKLENERKT